MSSSERCAAWVGLEPPQSVDCELAGGHDGAHRARIVASERVKTGTYENVDAVLTWPAHCPASTSLTSDEDGPLPEPIEVFCRLKEGHREMHYNGYVSWGVHQP